MKEIQQQIKQWLAQGEEVAIATVVDLDGSAPRPLGSRLAVTRAGRMVGSVSGGCVESDVHERALLVLDGASPALVHYGPAPPDAFEVGLSCDGDIEVLIERFAADEVWTTVQQAVESDRSAAMGTVLLPEHLRGKRMGILRGDDGDLEQVGNIHPGIDARISLEAAKLLESKGRRCIEVAEGNQVFRVFVEAFSPPQRMYVIGATHIAVSLCKMAKEVGFNVILIEPRTAFTEGDRFAAAHTIHNEWPVNVLDGAVLDDDAYVLTLTHDVKFDLPTLARALESGARYIGALGSRKTHQKRIASLRDQGFDEQALERIKTPVGLDLGGRSPEEIALAILAEMVAARYERDGRSLSTQDPSD